MESLKPNGLLFYQSYTKEKITQTGPKNLQFLLAENELLNLFSPLKLIHYRENSALGNTKKGIRNQAQFIGQKC